MKSKKPIVFKVQHPVMSDNDFRQLLEGIIVQRDNLIRYGTPYPPNHPDGEVAEQRKRELDEQIAEYKNKIKKLEEEKAGYEQLLRIIFEEEGRVKDEQRHHKTGNTSNYMQPLG